MTATPALKRVAVIGASMSDGFLLPLEVDAMVTFADFVEAAVKHEAEPVFRRSSASFFNDPIGHGARFAAAAHAHEPSLVIAIDYLFWYGYGFVRDDDARLERLDVGLANLAPFECPVLIADFPDMTRASVGGEGIHGLPMLHPWQIPSAVCRKRLSARVLEWAGERANAHVVGIADLVDRIHAGEAVEVRGNHWPENSQRTLVDKDLLHTTFEGTAALTFLVFDALVRGDAAVPEDAFVWDKDVVMKRVLKARAAERRQRGVRDL